MYGRFPDKKGMNGCAAVKQDAAVFDSETVQNNLNSLSSL